MKKIFAMQKVAMCGPSRQHGIHHQPQSDIMLQGVKNIFLKYQNDTRIDSQLNPVLS